MFTIVLCKFCRCTAQSVLTGCITSWYGSFSAQSSDALKRAVKQLRRLLALSFQQSGTSIPHTGSGKQAYNEALQPSCSLPWLLVNDSGPSGHTQTDCTLRLLKRFKNWLLKRLHWSVRFSPVPHHLFCTVASLLQKGSNYEYWGHLQPFWHFKHSVSTWSLHCRQCFLLLAQVCCITVMLLSLHAFYCSC